MNVPEAGSLILPAVFAFALVRAALAAVLVLLGIVFAVLWRQGLAQGNRSNVPGWLSWFFLVLAFVLFAVTG